MGNSYRAEVDSIRKQREHNQIAIRHEMPKYGDNNFRNEIQIGSSRYRIDGSTVTSNHGDVSRVCPSVTTLVWDGKDFKWFGIRGRLAAEASKSHSAQLEQSSAERWLQGFYGNLERPSVSVGFKLGGSRRQAKFDREVARHQTCFVFPTASIAKAFDDLVVAGLALRSSALGVSHRSEMYLDPLTGRKGFGGATKLVSNGKLSISSGVPNLAATNFVPLLFEVELRNIFLLPHLIVIQSGSATQARSYDAIRLEVSEWQMQVNSVPQGSEFLGYVWRFMNKDGGPDRRYNDNYQIPVIRAWEIDFFIQGIGELHLAFSSRNAVFAFKTAYEKFAVLLE